MAVDIRSSHNIGSIFRTCDGFGASVVLCGISPRPQGGSDDTRLPHIAKKAHGAIAKTALGAEESVSWQYYEKPEAAINELRAAGYKIYAIEQSDSSKDLRDLQLGQDMVLLLGNEVEGLSESILALCDETYEIPMIGSKESFNVTNAAAIALYQSRLDITS